MVNQKNQSMQNRYTLRKVENTKETWFSFIWVILIVGGIIAFFTFANKQTASDCKSEQKYDEAAGRCVSIYDNVGDLEKEISAENAAVANKEKNRKNGAECIPASEAYNYIGVTGCVQLGVYTVNHTDYGYAWLDSESSDSPTEFMVFAKNNVLTVADTNYYFGRIIQVRGTIEEYDGKAQIEITSKSAITDIESIQDRQTRTMQTITETQKQVNCENYKKFKKYCDDGMKNFCSTANIYKNSCS